MCDVRHGSSLALPASPDSGRIPREILPGLCQRFRGEQKHQRDSQPETVWGIALIDQKSSLGHDLIHSCFICRLSCMAGTLQREFSATGNRDGASFVHNNY